MIHIEELMLTHIEELMFDKGLHIEHYIAPFKPALASMKMRSIKELP